MFGALGSAISTGGSLPSPSPGGSSSAPASLTTSRQDRPQPLKQHFCSPPQSASEPQSSVQLAYWLRFNLGQTPSFVSSRHTALIKKRRKKRKKEMIIKINCNKGYRKGFRKRFTEKCQNELLSCKIQPFHFFLCPRKL